MGLPVPLKTAGLFRSSGLIDPAAREIYEDLCLPGGMSSAKPANVSEKVM